MNEWMNGWVDGCMYARIGGQKGCMGGQIAGWLWYCKKSSLILLLNENI